MNKSMGTGDIKWITIEAFQILKHMDEPNVNCN